MAIEEPEIQNKAVHRAAMRVLNSLDRWSERLDGHHSQKREHQRIRLRVLTTINAPESNAAFAEADDAASFQAWTRNVSRGGLTFIYPQQLSHDKILVCLDQKDGDPIWFHADIVRQRPVQEGFWEYGVIFRERAAT